MKHIIIILLPIILSSCLVTPAMKREQAYIQKIEALERELQKYKLEAASMKTVSPIVELKTDYRDIPSYCLVEKYSIVKMGNRYFVRLPHGTIDSDNATPYALFKAISGCYTRMNGQDSFVYRIRNGKSWTTEKAISQVNGENFMFLLTYLKQRFTFEGKEFYIPKNVEYSLPTSEKMFIGNIPTGSRFSGKKLAVGMYWENSWGAKDIDLHALNLDGHVGWNAHYNQGDGALMYSGDITNAPHGAVEYMYAGKGLKHASLLQINIFSGSDTCKYKIIVGKGDKMSREYMMNPNNLFMEVTVESIQKQNVLGMFLPKGERQTFVLLNFGAGSSRVSGKTNITEIANKALRQQWDNAYTFNDLIKSLGGLITDVREEADYDFSLDTLEKDSFIKVFTEIEVEV